MQSSRRLDAIKQWRKRSVKEESQLRRKTSVLLPSSSWRLVSRLRSRIQIYLLVPLLTLHFISYHRLAWPLMGQSSQLSHVL